jgi:hypothetical protein
MLRHTNAVLAQLPADQFTSRQASAADCDSPMERSGGPLDDTLRVQCVERFLCHFAGDAQKVLAPTNPLCVPNQCAARMYGSSPHQPITAFASVSDCRPSMQSSGLSHGARRNPPARRQHALARVSNSRASHWQAHAFGAVARQEQIHILVERGLPHSLPTGSVPDAKKVELRGRDRRGRPIVWCDSADGPYSCGQGAASRADDYRFLCGACARFTSAPPLPLAPAARGSIRSPRG